MGRALIEGVSWPLRGRVEGLERMSVAVVGRERERGPLGRERESAGGLNIWPLAALKGAQKGYVRRGGVDLPLK